MHAEKNSLRYIISQLNECKNIEEEITLIKSSIAGPKIFAAFSNFDAA
jgi:hypothetical protein